MAGYELRIRRSAVKEIERIPRMDDCRRVVATIQALAVDPRPPGCAKLSDREQYRVRRGWYRIVYAVDDDDRIVLVAKVGHRRDVYR